MDMVELRNMYVMCQFFFTFDQHRVVPLVWEGFWKCFVWEHPSPNKDTNFRIKASKSILIDRNLLTDRINLIYKQQFAAQPEKGEKRLELF